MDNRTTVLGVLRRACDLLDQGQHPGIIEAISSLREEASGRTRDLAYYAVLETAATDRSDASLATLTGADRKEPALALLKATIRRMTAGLH